MGAGCTSTMFSTTSKPWNVGILHNLHLWNQHDQHKKDIDHLVDVLQL